MDTALVDSNILLRLLQPAHPQYPVAISALAALRRQKVEMCIVPQNLVEFWAVATRPLVNNGLGMSSPAVATEIRSLRNLFHLLEGKPGIVDVWEKLVGQYLVMGKQAHDAQLVAAMLVHGVRRLLTFNAQDFKRYPAVEVIVPDTVAIQQG